MTRLRKALSIAAVFGLLAGTLSPVQAEDCCQGYCACRDWQTGGTFNGCQISYDAEDNVTGVTCGYVVVQCCLTS